MKNGKYEVLDLTNHPTYAYAMSAVRNAVIYSPERGDHFVEKFASPWESAFRPGESVDDPDLTICCPNTQKGDIRVTHTVHVTPEARDTLFIPVTESLIRPYSPCDWMLIRQGINTDLFRGWLEQDITPREAMDQPLVSHGHGTDRPLYRDDLLDAVRDSDLDFTLRDATKEGYKPYEKVPETLIDNSIYLHFAESCSPLSLYEAMSMGMPCVTVPSPGAEDNIVNGHNGYIVESEDELFDAVEALRGDPEHAVSVGYHARQTVLDVLGLTRFQHQWERAFERAYRVKHR